MVQYICREGGRETCRIRKMPKKVRELKVLLHKYGFVSRSGKGSHTVWGHSLLVEKVTLSGKDGDDAQGYQEKDVRKAIRKLREVQGEEEV